MSREDPYYRADLARIHHLGFGFHADDSAPGILALLEPTLARDGLVVELGCGSGLLTGYLVEAGHRVIATDASPAMPDIAREYAGGAKEIRRLVLPDDPIPNADAIVSTGDVLSYLPNAAAIDHALVASAEALRPGGLLAINICDLTWGSERSDWNTRGGWARTGRWSPSSRSPLRTASSGRWRSSPGTMTDPGGGTTNDTTTS
jgi:SAM-dependent methyltransferase